MKTNLDDPLYDEEMGRTAQRNWSDPNKVGGKYMAGVIADFAPALKEIAKLGSMNNKPHGKYERGSWRKVENPEVEYHDAFWRHLLEGRFEIDPDTKMPHDVAIAWNALALICFRLEREEKERNESNFKAPTNSLGAGKNVRTGKAGTRAKSPIVNPVTVPEIPEDA